MTSNASYLHWLHFRKVFHPRERSLLFSNFLLQWNPKVGLSWIWPGSYGHPRCWTRGRHCSYFSKAAMWNSGSSGAAPPNPQGQRDGKDHSLKEHQGTISERWGNGCWEGETMYVYLPHCCLPTVHSPCIRSRAYFENSVYIISVPFKTLSGYLFFAYAFSQALNMSYYCLPSEMEKKNPE